MRNRLFLYFAAAGVTLLASAASAQAISIKKIYPKAIDSNGNAVSVAGSNGTAAWLSRENEDRPDYFLHILEPGEKQATKVAVQSDDAYYSDLKIEAAGDGKITVVAVAHPKASLPARDIVAIDPASGAVTNIKGAASPDADEYAPALADGTLFFAFQEYARTHIKQVPVTGGEATTFATLPNRWTYVYNLTAFPGNPKKLGMVTDTTTVRPGGRNMSIQVLQTMTASGKVRVITTRTQRDGWEAWFVDGPYVDDKGDMFYAAGRTDKRDFLAPGLRTKLYRVGRRKPLRDITLGAAWVGGDLGWLANPFVGKGHNHFKTTLRATGPIESR